MAEQPRQNADGTPVGRRALLGMLGAGAADLAAAPYLQRGWEGFLGAASQVDATGRVGCFPTPAGSATTASSVRCRENETNYELTVDGLVDRPRTYTLSDLRTLPQTRIVHDVLCTDGWRVDDTPFEGVRLADLVDAAGVRSEGTAIRFTCFDGAYTESLTLEQARRSDNPAIVLTLCRAGPGTPRLT